MFVSFLKSAWRNIKKHPAFSVINAGGLTIGLASCMLLLLYVSYHRSYNTQFPNLENIYFVENNQPGEGMILTFPATPRLAAAGIKEEVPGVVEAVRVVNYTGDGLLTYNNDHYKKNGMFADSGFFTVFPHRFLKGNPKTALTQTNSVVITTKLAALLFGTEDPMNRLITRNHRIPLMVTGVVEPMPANNNFQFDFIMPYSIFEESNAWSKTGTGWGNNYARTYVLLKDPSVFNQANAQVKSLIRRHDKDNKNVLWLYPFSRLHLFGSFEEGRPAGGLIDQIHLFEILAAVILLIACVNFMNLSTARSEKRAREVGIRKAIGSGRGSLIQQFITESMVLSFMATVLALCLVVFCLPFFNQLLGLHLTLPLGDYRIWIAVVMLAVITGLVAGSYPALYLSSFQPIRVLKGLFKGRGNALTVRKGLVIVQFAFAVFLITATICIFRQIRYVQDRPTGYTPAGMVEIMVEGDLGNKADLFIEQLKNNGSIIHGTGASTSINDNGNNTWGVEWPGKQPNQKILFDIFGAGYDFTKTAGVQLIAGREFSRDFPADTMGVNIMINESAAAIMNLKDPVGKVIKWGGEPQTIIGVFRDFVLGSPYSKTQPMMTPFIRNNGAYKLILRLNPSKSVSQSMEGINAALKSINPSYPPEIQFVDSNFAQKFANERLLATLANLFGALAIIISSLGLFGLAAYAAEQRVKEIGVRKVLGASILNITSLLSKDFIKLVAIAIVIAVPVSVWVLSNWLRNYEFRIALSWWFFVAAGVVTILIATLTVSYQAIRAALANPVRSLRSE